MLRDRFQGKIRLTAKRSTRHALQHGGVTGGRSHVRRATNNPVQVTSNPAKVVKNVKINITGGEHEGRRSTRQHRTLKKLEVCIFAELEEEIRTRNWEVQGGRQVKI